MSGDELALYEAVYRSLEDQILQPDVLVYLHASQSVLLERIKKRGRPFEEDFDPAYLCGLSEAYQDYFATYDRTPLLRVDTSQLNIPASAELVDHLFERITKMATEPPISASSAG